MIQCVTQIVVTVVKFMLSRYYSQFQDLIIKEYTSINF